MASLNNAQVVAAQLEKVEKTIPILFERDDVFYSTIEKRNVEVISSRDMRVPLELRTGGRFGMFNSDGGDLGRGSGPTWDKALVNTSEFRYAVEWTKRAEWSTDDSRKSVMNTLKQLLAQAMPEYRRNVESMCMTDGTGVLGTITSSSTTANKDSYVMTTDGFGVKLLRFDQALSVYNAALSTRRTFTLGASFNGYAPIDLIDIGAKTVRFNGTTGATVPGDKLVVEGVTTTPPVSLLGVPYHYNDASTGTWLGLDRGLNPEVRANRVTANGSLALPQARLAVNKIGDRIGKKNTMKPVAWMHECQIQAYEELGQLVSVIQKQAKSEGLNVYFNESGMQLAGCPVMGSYCWDKTRIDFIVKEIWGRAEMHPAKFYDVDGKRIFEVRSADGGVNTTQIFYLTSSFNTYINNPAAASYISGLTVPSGY